MAKRTLKFNNEEMLRNFISEISLINCDIDAGSKSIMVDAKSLLGVMYLSSNPIDFYINSDDENINKFFDICDKYERMM